MSSCTMLDVEEMLEPYRAKIVQHRFLTRLEGAGTLEQLRQMLPCMAFYTMVFQDILRTAKDRSSDISIRALAERHEVEDKGHDQWFLDDAGKLGVTISVEQLFSAEHEITRDIAYELMSEVRTAKHDCTRLAIVLSLEAIGREFFLRVPGFVERAGFADSMKYFAVRHLDIERSHEIFGQDSRSRLAAVTVAEIGVAEASGAIQHVFDAMTRLADHLGEAMEGLQR